jgi:hypothetical protein
VARRSVRRKHRPDNQHRSKSVAKDKYFRSVRHMAETAVPIGYEVLLRESRSDNESATYFAHVSATNGRTCDSTLNENEGVTDDVENGTLPCQLDRVARAVNVTGSKCTSYQNQPTTAVSRYKQLFFDDPVAFEKRRLRHNARRCIRRAKVKAEQEQKNPAYTPIDERAHTSIDGLLEEWEKKKTRKHIN